MEKKSIAFIIGSLNSGGAERVVSTLSNELVKIYDVTIILFKADPPFYPLDPKIKVVSCIDKIAPSTNIVQALKLNYTLYTKIKEKLRECHIDLVIGFLTRPNILAILAARSIKIPVVVSERNNPMTDNPGFLWNKLRRILYPKANCVIVQTELIRDFFVNWVSSSKLLILPNPISPDLKSNLTEPLTKKNIVLNVGRLTEQKGQDVLIKAFSSLNIPNWELIIVGEGKNRDAYQKLIDEQDMSTKIHLVGKKTNIQSYYATAKIFAFSSRFEGFPNALIEAMHMGLPCVSTDCPTGPSKLITDNKNGYLITVDDQEALTTGLKRLMKQPELRKKFGEISSETVKYLTVENVSKEWNSVISSILEPTSF